MKLKAEIFRVSERKGVWQGREYATEVVDGMLRTPSGEYFGMLVEARVPERLKGLRPGSYDAEIAFEYRTDKRAFVVRIESMSPAKVEHVGR